MRIGVFYGGVASIEAQLHGIVKLKGDGWYETDFKDQKPKNKDASEKVGSEKDGKGKKDAQSSKDKGSEKSSKKSESKTVTAKKETSAASSPG